MWGEKRDLRVILINSLMQILSKIPYKCMDKLDFLISNTSNNEVTLLQFVLFLLRDWKLWAKNGWESIYIYMYIFIFILA